MLTSSQNYTDLAAQLGIELFEDVPKGKRCRCPSGTHEDKNPSAILFEDSGWVYCHACGFSKGLRKMAYEAGVSTDGLQYTYVRQEDKPYEYKELIINHMEAFPASSAYDSPLYEDGPYLGYQRKSFKEWIKMRGIKPETLDRVQALHWFQGLLRWDGSMDSLQYPYRFAIPCCDDQGRLIGLEFRKYTFDEKDNWIPKVQYIKDFPKKYFLWNQHELDKIRMVYATEGIMDCLRIMDVGTYNVCSTYGAGVSKHQLKILSDLPHLTWVMDRDYAGLEAVIKVAEARQGQLNVVIPYGKDIGEGTDWHVKDALKNRVVNLVELLEDIDRDWLVNPRNYDEDEQNIHWI